MKTVTNGTTLTKDMLDDAIKIIQNRPDFKKEFFSEFFPSVEDCNDWVVLIPETSDDKLMRYVENYSWMYIDKYNDKVTAIKMPQINTGFPFIPSA